VREDELDPQDLLRLWRGELDHAYGEGAVISTLAAVLRLLSKGEERPVDEWVEQARRLWQARDQSAFCLRSDQFTRVCFGCILNSSD
jgi:CO dehydrogenase/acetyl-CoA synthase beta subunit